MQGTYRSNRYDHKSPGKMKLLAGQDHIKVEIRDNMLIIDGLGRWEYIGNGIFEYREGDMVTDVGIVTKDGKADKLIITYSITYDKMPLRETLPSLYALAAIFTTVSLASFVVLVKRLITGDFNFFQDIVNISAAVNFMALVGVGIVLAISFEDFVYGRLGAPP